MSNLPAEKSNILIITICSNTKIKFGNKIKGNYTSEIGISLPTDLAQQLYGTRHKMRKLITSGNVSQNDKPLRELPFNADLIDGPDSI